MTLILLEVWELKLISSIPVLHLPSPLPPLPHSLYSAYKSSYHLPSCLAPSVAPAPDGRALWPIKDFPEDRTSYRPSHLTIYVCVVVTCEHISLTKHTFAFGSAYKALSLGRFHMPPPLKRYTWQTNPGIQSYLRHCVFCMKNKMAGCGVSLH